jgi:hypothetical protein
VIKNIMGTLLQVLEIIFEVQNKRNNEKIIRREISFPIYKTHFFPFFCLLTPPTCKPHNFLISYSFENVIKIPLEVLQIIFTL